MDMDINILNNRTHKKMAQEDCLELLGHLVYRNLCYTKMWHEIETEPGRKRRVYKNATI